MRQRSSLFLVGVAAVAWSCGSATPEPAPPPSSGQSLEQAVRMICDVDKLAGLTAADNIIEMGQQRTEWVNQHIENPDAIEFKTLLSVNLAEDQVKMLREKASQLALGGCALADSIEKDDGGVLAP